MGNRFTKKKKTKQDAAAAGALADQKEIIAAAVPNSAVPVSDPASRKDDAQTAADNEVEVPLSARQAPPTARDGTEDSPLNFFRRCYELDEDPFTLYTQALLLKGQREFAAASELLRCLLSNGSLAVEVRSHLAQCLIAQDPELRWCRQEATRCLEEVLAATSPPSNNADSSHSAMYRESLELLAHVMIAGKRFDRALQLLDALQVALGSDAAVAAAPPNAALRQQQTLVSFQRAFCRYARGDAPDAVSAELLCVLPPKLEPAKETQQGQEQEQEEDEPETSDPFEGIELLLHADAASLRQGLTRLGGHFNLT